MSYFIAFLTIIIFILFVFMFIKFGKKLLHYKEDPNIKDEVNKDLLEELKNIQSIKIDIVPARELYAGIAGNMMLFSAYFWIVSLIGAIISNTLFIPGEGFGGLIYNVIISGIFWLIYSFFVAPLVWQYAFFSKAMLPNMKHKDEINRRTFKLVKFVGVATALPIWISASVHVEGFFEYGIASGTTIVGYFIGIFLLVGIPLFTIKAELQRLGLPNLLENIQTLLKNRSQR